VQAATPVVSIALFPQQLELPVDGVAESVVSVTNESDMPLKHIRVSAVGASPVTVQISPSDSQDLVAHGVIAWSIAVRRGSGPAAAKLPLRVDYVWENEAAGVRIETPGLGLATLEIREADPAGNPTLNTPLAEVEIKTTLHSLTHDKPGLILLLVGNRSAFPVTVTVEPTDSSLVAVTSDGQVSRFIELRRTTSNAAVRIERGGTAEIQYTVTARERVNPGPHLVAFDVNIVSPVRSQTIVATHEFLSRSSDLRSRNPCKCRHSLSCRGSSR
jgi:hypothetical protein